MAVINLIYREDFEKRSKTSRHYNLESGDAKGLLSSRLRLSTDRGYANRVNPNLWLYEYKETKYSDKASTGLFRTPVYGEVYSGDLDAKSHLVTVARLGSRLDIKIRVDHYPFDKRLHPKTVANRIKKI